MAGQPRSWDIPPQVEVEELEQEVEMEEAVEAGLRLTLGLAGTGVMEVVVGPGPKERRQEKMAVTEELMVVVAAELDMAMVEPGELMAEMEGRRVLVILAQLLTM